MEVGNIVLADTAANLLKNEQVQQGISGRGALVSHASFLKTSQQKGVIPLKTGMTPF